MAKKPEAGALQTPTELQARVEALEASNEAMRAVFAELVPLFESQAWSVDVHDLMAKLRAAAG